MTRTRSSRAASDSRRRPIHASRANARPNAATAKTSAVRRGKINKTPPEPRCAASASRSSAVTVSAKRRNQRAEVAPSLSSVEGGESIIIKWVRGPWPSAWASD